MTRHWMCAEAEGGGPLSTAKARNTAPVQKPHNPFLGGCGYCGTVLYTRGNGVQMNTDVTAPWLLGSLSIQN